MQFSLFNREFSARLELYSKLETEDRKKLSQKCETFYVINNKASCELDEELVKFEQAKIYEFDHVWNRSPNPIIVYLDISGHNFPKISQSIKFFCLYHNTSYILRHVDVRSKTIDLLGGYGVELISKDDIEPQTDFDYKILYDFYKLLPDWKSVNQRIENSQYKYSDFTEEFKNDTLIYSRKNRKYEEKGLLLINNLYVPADFFIVLGTLRALNNALIGLKDLHIPHTIAVKILNKFNLEFSIKSNKYVITNSKSGRVYINDLENDKKYANWSEDLNQFLMPYGFRLDKIAKNIFNLIAVINLQHKAAWEVIDLMLDFYTKEYPVRIGFIFSGNSDVIDILNYGIGEFKNEEMYMLRFLSKFSHQTTIKEAEYMLKYYCDKCDLNKITNETRKLAQKFTAKHSLNSIHFLLNGRILDINLNSIIENQLLFEIYLEKRQIMVKSNDGTLKLPFNNTFEYLKHEKPEKIIYKDNLLEENELSEHIKFGYIFEMNSLPKYITFTAILTENDEKILWNLLDLIKNENLLMRIRFVFRSNHLDEKWLKILCYIKKTNEIKSFINFDEFECDYERAYIEAVFVKSQNLTQGLIVNGKFLQNYQNLTSNDLYLIYEYSNSKINYSYLYENLKFITNHHKISKIIEISSYILLKHLSHIPHLFSYSSYPLVTHKRISRLITATNETSFNIDVVLNPFKKSGKRLIALGKWLLNLDSTINITMTASNIENTNVNTSPKFNHNNLYKFLIKNKFESDLTFENRNGKYWIKLDCNDNWDISNENSLDTNDLNLSQKLKVNFKLNKLLITGQSRFLMNGFEILMRNSTQISLNRNEDKIAETWVMKTLGYFQFGTQPGIYRLNCDTNLMSILENHDIVVKDLSGLNLNLDISYNKNPVSTEITPFQDTRIHIFSLASGKTYEKFLKIMISSVLYNTKSKIKFWLLDEFFSKNIHDSLKLLSETFNFEYEFVSYKWPNWLVPQGKNNYMVFAHRALFLDMIFPKEVTRVISLDCDQIIREDIKELWDLDLLGNPHGFVPFCEGNREMEDLHFWTHGWWLENLHGKSYNFYGMFVLDLEKFRRLEGGEVLRHYYEYFVNKPGSLYNLDQDLVNVAQNELPITKLPSDWLWCETWCSQESKNSAKLIDLCSNSKTKETKVSMADRISNEWDYYDKLTHKDYREDL